MEQENLRDIFNSLPGFPVVEYLSMRTGSSGFSMKVHSVGLDAHHYVIAQVEDGLRPPLHSVNGIGYYFPLHTSFMTSLTNRPACTRD